MNTRQIVIQIAHLCFYLFFQVMVLRAALLFEMATCFFYIGFIIALPLSISRQLLLLIAFALGLIVDMFYNTMGMNAAACVLLAFLKPYMFKYLFPQQKTDSDYFITIANVGLRGFLLFAGGLTFIHHVMLFYVEMGSFSLFSLTLAKVIMSTFFTTVVLLVAQYLLFSRRIER